MREILRWFHVENGRLGINPLTRSATAIPNNAYYRIKRKGGGRLRATLGGFSKLNAIWV